MNEAGLPRKRASATAIEQAFIQLLMEGDRRSVSVARLCKRAGVNRSTFYSNFENIEAVENALCASLEELFRQVDPAQNEEGFLRLFEHIQAHQPLYRAYFKLGRNLQYRSLHCDARIDQAYSDKSDRAYHDVFFRAGITGIIEKWLFDDCAASPAEMTHIVRSKLP